MYPIKVQPDRLDHKPAVEPCPKYRSRHFSLLKITHPDLASTTKSARHRDILPGSSPVEAQTATPDSAIQMLTTSKNEIANQSITS